MSKPRIASTRAARRCIRMPAEDGGGRAAVSHGKLATALTGLPRTIRRQGLRLIVPLAESTIYEMEQRGEFPGRFSLSPRCVVWDLEEVEAWLAERKRASDAGLMLAEFFKNDHRQQARAGPAMGIGVERRRRLTDSLAIAASEFFSRTCWITFQLRGITVCVRPDASCVMKPFSICLEA